MVAYLPNIVDMVAAVGPSENHNWHRVVVVVDSRMDFGLAAAVEDIRWQISMTHNRFAGNVAVAAEVVHPGYLIDPAIRVVCDSRSCCYGFYVHDADGMATGNVCRGVDRNLDSV